MRSSPQTLADIIRAAEPLQEQQFFSFIPAGESVATERATFGRFVDRALRLAQELRSAGLRVGSRFALVGRPDIQYVETLTAGLLLGAIVLPVNHLFKERELGEYLHSLDCDALYGDATTLARVIRARDDFGSRVLILSFEDVPGVHRLCPLESDLFDRLPEQSIDPDGLGAVLHTSGTTGLPKGVAHSHRDYVSFLHKWAQWGPRSTDRILSFSPLYHQAGLLLQFLAALHVGASITQLETFSARTFWDIVDSTKSTAAVLVPPVPSYLLAAPESPADSGHCLEWVSLGGRGDHWQQFQDRFKVSAHSGYASTEMTIFCLTGHRDSPPCAPERLARPGFLCGRAPDGWAEIRIVDELGHPVDGATVGRIEIRGEALCSGYLNRPEGADFDLRDGGWLRTGDSGYLLPSGDLYLVERTKDLIRRSQENIAPAEIEAALLDHPGIAEAAVIPVPDDFREQEIRACIVLVPGAAVTPTEVFQHCASLLADFKVPRYLDFRGSLPRTPTMKIRKQLLIQDSDPHEWIDRQNLSAGRGVPLNDERARNPQPTLGTRVGTPGSRG